MPKDIKTKANVEKKIKSFDRTKIYMAKTKDRLLEAKMLSKKASNSLDEYIIRDLIMQGAEIDSFGVGERLVTSKSEPVFGGVYKLVAAEKDGKIIPKIKLCSSFIKVVHFV